MSTDIPVSAGAAFGPAAVSLADSESSGPCGPSGGPEKYGLALSGGGFRAALFHVGALTRLNELGLLRELDRVSTVSGGSLVAGFLATAWRDLEFDASGCATNFETLVGEQVVRFCQRRLDAFIIAAGLLPGVNPAGVLAGRLDRFITHGATLQDLPDHPRFVFNAAHVATGVTWRFSKPYMGDYRLGLVCRPETPLAHAIAASAAFPPFVAPFVLDLPPGAVQWVEGADLFGDSRYDSLKRRVLLLDGGAYDNLGLEAVEGRCQTVLASDAGGNLRVDARDRRYRWWWPLLRRTLDMAVDQGRAQRRRTFIAGATATRALREAGLPTEGVTERALLWRTSQDVQLLQDKWPPEWQIQPEWRRYLSTRPTRMWPHSKSDWQHLVNWGYLTSDLVVRTHLPVAQNTPPPTALPYPKADFAASP